MATDLHTGVQFWVALHLELQREVFERSASKKRILAGTRFADDRTITNFVRGIAANFGPAVKRLTVEEGRPFFGERVGGKTNANCEGERENQGLFSDG